ncbi:MAG TPA: GNAT family N-acetyltransferase [Solirubrobacteraceae bacterium]|jgi:CelD/BcsL family acetyltransferase involved in cellulose biosynthesis|nr:GNAT family N-acetyltransferase [Solirubrobacteraceae bacterium]
MSDVELVSDLAAIEALAPEWDALAIASSNPVAAPSWVLAWWKHAAPAGLQPRVVAVRERGALLGLAPFCIGPSREGLRECRLMASEFGVCMEPLAMPGSEWIVAGEVARALAASLPRIDVVAFGPMTIASRWPSALQEQWPGRVPAVVRRYRVERAPVVILREPTYEAWLGSLSSKLRRAMRLGERDFAQAGGTTRWTTAETLHADIETFARLHKARWEGRGWSRLVDLGERLSPWFEQLARDLLAEQRFRMCVLEVGETPICVDFGLLAGGELAAINSAWDEDYAKLSPAKLAVARVVESAYELGARRVHLGSGEQENKLRLANGDDPVAWTLLLPSSPRLPYAYARLLPLFARSYVRDVATRALPGEKVARLRSLSRRSGT